MNALLAESGVILRNDLRLLWRDFRASRWAALGKAGWIALIMIALHFGSILLFWNLERKPPIFVETLIWFFFGFFMLGGAMNHAIAVLFERSDFDLLLAAPVASRAVLLARLSSIAAVAFFSVGFFLFPLLDGAIVGLSLNYFFGYIVWILLAAFGAAVGVSLTLASVRAMGARRARTLVQVAGGVVGATIYLFFQSQNFLPVETKLRLSRMLALTMGSPAAGTLARAGRGSALDLLWLAAVALGSVVITTRQLAATFVSGVQESGTQRTKKPATLHYRFAQNLHYVTFLKDVRLIIRDPLLLSQILPSLIYVVPAFLGLQRRGGLPMLAPIAVVVAAQFSSLLTSVAASGEEGFDLIRASPSPEIALRHAKMAAGMALPVTLSTLLCVAVAVTGQPWLALIALITSFATAAACSWLQVATIQPSPRRDIFKRRSRRESKGFIVALLFLTGAAGVGLIAFGSTWVFGVIALGLTALGIIACFTLVELKELSVE